ncbi:MAG: hypothetical protein LBH69_02275 [Methanomassiliicoccaceae archaeon]|nr:hypothetical protein [Methanomassiliicoccaceae archaeon]
MDNDAKKALYPFIALALVYTNLCFVLLYHLENDAPIYLVAYTIFAMAVAILVLRNFFSRTVFREADHGRPAKELKPLGSDDSGGMRTVTITMSRFIPSAVFELLADGVKITDAESGDKFRISMTADEHKLTVSSGADVHWTIPAGGDRNVYIWFERSSKAAKDLLRIEDVTAGSEDAVARDTASFGRFKRILNITIIGCTVACMGAVLVLILVL